MDAVKKIHDFLKFGSVLGLERMTVLLEKLSNPHKDLKVIHVAGTNGKGSTCRYMYEALREEGYSTGLYTSPFLEVFNERIELNGKYISDEDLETYTDIVLEKTKEMVDEGYESPTEFEVVTAIAFLYFKEKHADYVVLEVGLGGRGDSTNVVEKPLASVITSISFDHTERLGHTIPEITSEKAGIIKKNVPVITGTDRADAQKVIEEKAESLNAPVYKSCDIKYEIIKEDLEVCEFSVKMHDRDYRICITMPGHHQIQNAITALYTLLVLREGGSLRISDESIKKGFRNARQTGRFEVLKKNPYIILDGAHNPDGTKVLKETVLKHFKHKRILITMGILADKDHELIDNMIEIGGDFVITEPDNPRKMKASQLASIIEEKGGCCVTVPEPSEAVKYALSVKDNYDLLLFSGSLYLIGEIRGYLK